MINELKKFLEKEVYIIAYRFNSDFARKFNNWLIEYIKNDFVLKKSKINRVQRKLSSMIHFLKLFGARCISWAIS